MTRQMEILLAIKALIVAALPLADIRGFDGDSSVPEVIGAGGLVIGTAGDPGEPEIDLSPPAYNYRHRIPLELAAGEALGGASLDAMLIAIGGAVVAARQLGGLCDFLDVTAATFDDRTEDDVTVNWADIDIIAEYSTSNPLA